MQRNRHAHWDEDRSVVRDVLIRSRQNLHEWHDRLDGVERIAEALPLIVSAAQRTNPVDAQFVQGHGSLGGCGLTGAGAVENDVPVARDLMNAFGQRLWGQMQRARQCERVGQQFERVAQVDNKYRLAGVHLAFQFLGLEAGCDKFAQEAATADQAQDEKNDNAEHEQCAGEASHPIQEGGVALDRIPEKPASPQQRADPKERANGKGRARSARALIVSS